MLMAKCPGCGRKLHLYNVKQTCPGCGANLVYFNSNEKLLEEAEKSEIEHARFQPRIDRGKVGTIKSKQGIIRLVTRVLPLGALFLPLAARTEGGTVNALGAYNYVSENDIASVLKSGFLSGDRFNLGLSLLLLSAVLIIVNLLMLFGAMGRRWKIRETLVTGFFTLVCALSAVFFAATAAEHGLSLSWGAFVYIFTGVLQVIFNIFLIKTAVPVDYTPWLPEDSENRITGSGLPVKYTQCLIGGLDSREYFRLVAEGKTKEEIRRVMLPVLARMQIAADEERRATEAEKKKEEDAKHGIES